MVQLEESQKQVLGALDTLHTVRRHFDDRLFRAIRLDRDLQNGAAVPDVEVGIIRVEVGLLEQLAQKFLDFGVRRLVILVREFHAATSWSYFSSPWKKGTQYVIQSDG